MSLKETTTMKKHRLAKKKRSFKDTLKMVVATLAGATVLAAPALAQEPQDVHITGDIRSEQETVTHRYGLHTGRLGIDGFETNDKNSNGKDTGVIYTLTLADSIPGTNISSTAWYRKLSSSDGINPEETKTQFGSDFVFTGENGTQHYIFPAWITVKDGKTVGSDFIALGSQNLGALGEEGINVEYGVVACINGDDENDSIAWYTGPKGENLSGIIGRDYDNVWRTDVGFKTSDGELGGLVDAKYDPNTDKSQVKVMLAQDPGYITNVTGTNATGEVFVLDAYPTETNPYLPRIQDKSNGGASLDLVLGNEAGTPYGSVLAGYKVPFTWGDLGVSTGSDFREGEGAKPTLNAHLRALGKKLFCEFRAKQGESPEIYTRVNGINF